MNGFQDALISYGRIDSKAFAAKLNDRLIAAGLDVWLDFDDIPLGKDEQPPCIPTTLHCEFITESTKYANNLMTQVFLTFAKEDAPMAEQLRQSLMRNSITVWTHHRDIETGSELKQAIQQGIEEADNVAYLLSPYSLQADDCQQVLDYALSLNKRIIPLLVQKTDLTQAPPTLQDLRYIDLADNLTEADYQQAESQLLKILRQDADYFAQQKILLTKAMKWRRQYQNPSILLRGYSLHNAASWFKAAKQRTQHIPTSLQEMFISQSLQSPPASSLDVFIAYSQSDSDFAHRLNNRLQSRGKTTWFDQEYIPSEANFQQETYRGIEMSDNFLLILSPSTFSSPDCADQVK